MALVCPPRPQAPPDRDGICCAGTAEASEAGTGGAVVGDGDGDGDGAGPAISSPTAALPIRNRIGLLFMHCIAASSCLKMTSAVVGADRASYFRFLKYSTSPNAEIKRRISRDSPRLDGLGVMRRCTARLVSGRARDAMFGVRSRVQSTSVKVERS